MFRHQVMFVTLSIMLLLTFAYADATSISSGTHNVGTLKTPTDFTSMISTFIQTIMKHTIGNYTGSLNVVEFLNGQVVLAKKTEKELYEMYEKMLKKKESFEELHKKVNSMQSVKTTEDINRKVIEVQATASKGFQRLNEIQKMKEDIKQAIHESEIENNKCVALLNESFQYADSLVLENGPDAMNKLSSLPERIAEVLSSISSVNTHSDHVSVLLNKMEKHCDEAKKNINLAFKGLQEVEAAQNAISAMKQPLALGVKDAQGSIIKDSTSVPFLLSNFACFAGVVMFTVMSTNFL